MNAFRRFCRQSASSQSASCRWWYPTRPIIPNRPHTIFALSSGFGKCGVGVIRVSGPRAKLALRQLCKRNTKPRVASVCKIRDPHTKELLDNGLVIWFPGPKSFTGEDCVEFHVHGGHAVISSVLLALGSIKGLEPAQPGEFSKQAFVNGKMGLTEIEGLGDLVHAETEAQRKQALRQMEGDLNLMYSDWRTRLIKSLANVEAFIDFSEEENIEEDVIDTVCSEVSKLQREISAHLRDNRRGERLRNGVHVTIVGEPNVGKSSLLNVISQKPTAIVSPIAGTTRDVVETALNIAGYPVLISDTAGLRETSDVVEKEGVARALKRAEDADLKILTLDFQKHWRSIIDVTSLSEFVTSHMLSLGLLQDRSDEIPEDVPSGVHPMYGEEEISESSEVSRLSTDHNRFSLDLSQNLLVVVNKSDLMESAALIESMQHDWNSLCFISCTTGDGLETFLSVLAQKIKTLCGDPLLGSPNLTQNRHRHHLSKCQLYLQSFHSHLASDVVLAAEKLRMGVRELGLITGSVSTDDVLDVIFRDFCVGK